MTTKKPKQKPKAMNVTTKVKAPSSPPKRSPTKPKAEAPTSHTTKKPTTSTTAATTQRAIKDEIFKYITWSTMKPRMTTPPINIVAKTFTYNDKVLEQPLKTSTTSPCIARIGKKKC